LLLDEIEKAQARSGQSAQAVLKQLGLPRAPYYRWLERAERGTLADQLVIPHRKGLPPTPEEVAAVRTFALDQPAMGYKRLTWLMIDQDVAYLRPYQVYRILDEGELLSRKPKPLLEDLKRPAPPHYADQVWHVDLMYLYIRPRWYYLVDILDGYSRFLVHWSLNLTMMADTVTLTVQAALDQLERRIAGEPRIVHDHGSQFLSQEWRRFVAGAGLTDIKTRVAHPQSNGVLERLHRTHREEGLVGEALDDYYRALEAMSAWSEYYNHQRPHSALKYLCPVDYYRGDPEARLAEREHKLAQALVTRALYWETYASVKEQL
jgi:putative transposase